MSYGVLFQYSIERSCHFSIVVIEDSAEPFTLGDPAPAFPSAGFAPVGGWPPLLSSTSPSPSADPHAREGRQSADRGTAGAPRAREGRQRLAVDELILPGQAGIFPLFPL